MLISPGVKENMTDKGVNMKEITIIPNLNHFLNDGITEVPTFYTFNKINEDHIQNVKNLMSIISGDLSARSQYHDYTKVREPHKTDFYNAVYEKIKNGIPIDESDWAKDHYELERHHLNKHVPSDVDLIDVLEYVIDSIVSNVEQLGIKGNVTISNQDLMNALRNTVSKISDMIKIPEENDENKGD